jgi:methyltransferase
VSLCHWLVLLVAAQRLAEVAYARRNERRLLRQGGIEVGVRHYPLFLLLHGGWLLAIWMLVPANATVIWPLLAVFALLQVGRLWVIASLGRYWTTRVITLPGVPLVRRGPYRLARHPNYVVVAGEIAVLPLAFGAWEIALAFSLLNGLLLRHRIRVEDAALASRRGEGLRADAPSVH